MAKRAKNVPTVDVDTLVRVFVTLAEFSTSENETVTVQEMADEFDGAISEEMYSHLENLADAELIGFERGRVWVSREGVTQENAEDVAVGALNGFVPVPESRKRLEYATRAAESQDAVMSQSPEFTGKAPEIDYDDLGEEPSVIPAETPVIAENGEKITIPVDFDNPEKGRRELDASKGERLISEGTLTLKDKINSTTLNVVLTPARLPEIDGLSQFIDADTGDMVYESRIIRDGLALEEPTEVPPCPQGVNHNVWDMAHTAITESARSYWMRQANAVLHNQSADAPF